MQKQLIISIAHNCCGNVFHGACIPDSFDDDEFMEELKMYGKNQDKYVIDVVTAEEFKFSGERCEKCKK